MPCDPLNEHLPLLYTVVKPYEPLTFSHANGARTSLKWYAYAVAEGKVNVEVNVSYMVDAKTIPTVPTPAPVVYVECLNPARKATASLYVLWESQGTQVKKDTLVLNKHLHVSPHTITHYVLLDGGGMDRVDSCPVYHGYAQVCFHAERPEMYLMFFIYSLGPKACAPLLSVGYRRYRHVTH